MQGCLAIPRFWDGDPRFILHVPSRHFVSRVNTKVMKKNVFIFIFTFILLFCNKVYSQTVWETYQWINTTLSKMKIENKKEHTSFKISLYRDTVTNEINRFTLELNHQSSYDTLSMVLNVYIKDLIVFEKDKRTIGFMPKNGVFDGIVVNKGGVQIARFTKGNPVYMWFDETTENYIRLIKLIKAFNHLIKLTGGEVHDEDLF